MFVTDSFFPLLLTFYILLPILFCLFLPSIDEVIALDVYLSRNNWVASNDATEELGDLPKGYCLIIINFNEPNQGCAV